MKGKEWKMQNIINQTIFMTVYIIINIVVKSVKVKVLYSFLIGFLKLWICLLEAIGWFLKPVLYGMYYYTTSKQALWKCAITASASVNVATIDTKFITIFVFSFN